jgi:hypothetical protein
MTRSRSEDVAAVADLGPNKKRIAQLFRMLGSNGGERRNAFAALERMMRSGGITWTDIGDVIEFERDEDKYSESEMQEVAQAARAEGVEAGIKIGQARASNGGGNGHFRLPEARTMAEYCHDRPNRLKDDKQRDFVSNVFVITRRSARLSLKQLGYLASIYIQIGGRV